MTSEPFGTLDGTAVESITIENAGVSAKLISFGARLTELWVPDRHGTLADIVLGFDDLESYEATDTFFGATCGRYGNRISKGQFRLDGRNWQVDVNEGRNHLHGGKDGFDRKNWSVRERTENSVTFTAASEDGEMGFAGRANLTARYTLTSAGQLIIEMEADADKVTPMNMVHHTYFNLAGHGSGDVLDQEIRLGSRFYTPIDDELMTTGEVLCVDETPFDFREMKAIGKDIAALGGVGGEVFDQGGGYDHNWCLEGAGDALRFCAEARDPISGRRMVLETTEPGVQFYTGGYLSENITGKAGKRLCKYAGFTLETQKFPDTPNFAHFPSCILRPGDIYRQRMVFTFAAERAA